jgi:hypothetical protein
MGYFFLYYALGLPTFLFTIIALYLLFTGTIHVPRSLKSHKSKLPTVFAHAIIFPLSTLFLPLALGTGT